MACKALSPAVNDPYTAVQAVDHLSVIFCALAVRPLGDWVTADPDGAAVIVPGRRFGDYLATMCGLIRRYGSAEPTLSIALLRLLENCAAVLPADPARWSALGEQADLIVAGHLAHGRQGSAGTRQAWILGMMRGSWVGDGDKAAAGDGSARFFIRGS